MGEDWGRLSASSDVEERRKAALSLLEESSAIALPLLPQLLGDPNWRVRKAAVEVALAQAPKDIIPLMIEGLHDADNAGRRNTSLETLVKLGQAVLPYAYEALVEEDPDVKLALILLLGEIPGKGSVPHLIYYLSHENKNIVCAAITSLGRLRDPGNLPVLFDLMTRGDDWVLFHIVDALADTGGPLAAQKLMELYDTARFQKAILKALGKMADPGVIPFVLERALESRTHIPELMNTIGRIYNTSMPEAFLTGHQAEIGRILRNHFPLPLVDRIESIWQESKIPERRGMLLVAGSLTDLSLLPRVLDELDNPYLQRDAFQAASRYGAAAVPHLIKRLNATSSQQQKILLIQLLAATGSREAVIPLLSQAREEDFQIHSEALAALGQMEDPRALLELLDALRSEESSFHETALSSIRSLCRRRPDLRQQAAAAGKNLVANEDGAVRKAGYALISEGLAQGEIAPLLPGLVDQIPIVRQSVVPLVASKGGAEGFARLLPLLADANAKVRRAVIAALGRQLLASQPDVLVSALQDPDLWVRAESAQFLAQSTDPQTAKALLTLLEQDEMPVRLAALKGLAQVGCGPLFQDILQMAKTDDSPEIRRASLAAVGRSGRPEGYQALVDALRDHHWEIRASAIQLMGSLGDRRFIPALLREMERDQDALVKQTIVQALTNLKAIEAVPRLLHYLTDPEMKDAAFAFFTSLGKAYIPLIEQEAQSVDFQTKLVLIEIIKHLENS